MSAPTAAAAIVSRIPKWVWVLLALGVVFLLLRNPLRRGWYGLTNLLRRDAGDYGQGIQPEDGQTTAERKAQLQAMAEEAYAQLNAAIVSPTNREAALDAILSTNDTELRIVARHYKTLSRTTSLYADVNDAWMPFTDVDERLMARLSRINLR